MSITEITERAVLTVPIDRVRQVAVSGSRQEREACGDLVRVVDDAPWITCTVC
jgi:hypothetical protein